MRKAVPLATILFSGAAGKEAFRASNW